MNTALSASGHPSTPLGDLARLRGASSRPWRRQHRLKALHRASPRSAQRSPGGADDDSRNSLFCYGLRPMFESQAGDHDDDTADVDDVNDPTPGWHPTPPWGTRGSPPHTGVASLSVSRAPGEWEAATRTCLTQSGPSGASHSFSNRSAPNTTHPFRARPPASTSTGRGGIKILEKACPRPLRPHPAFRALF